MKRGSSGATVNVSTSNYTRVWKIGDERVGAQGRWLRSMIEEHHGEIAVLPYVFAADKLSYEMERLHEPNFGWLDTQIILFWMTQQLEDDIWSREPRVEFDIRAHQRKMLLYTPFQEMTDPAWSRFVDLRKEIDWESLRRCLTHGDPTYDNLMFRDNSDFNLPTPVLIDPIPATEAVPDLWSVDLGKILQSCLGWEMHRYSDMKMSFVSPKIFRQYVEPENEWHATVYWCVVHLLRTLPYVKNAVTRVGVGRMIDEALLLL